MIKLLNFYISLHYYGVLIWFSGAAYEPEAIFEWSNRKTCNGEAEVGYGIQRLLGISGRIYEFAGN